MKTKPATALQIRNGQLVVGGFYIREHSIPLESSSAQGVLITNPLSRMDGRYGATVPDLDVRSPYNHVTLAYNLEPDQFRDGTFLEQWRGPIIPNKAMIDPGLREATYRALHPETWYAHSRGTVGRKPVFEGQEPMKDVVVIGSSYRRGELPLVSARTREGQSFNLFPRVGLSRVIGRPINNGLSSQDIADWTAPVNVIGKSGLVMLDYETLRYQAGGPSPEVIGSLYRKLKQQALTGKHPYSPGKQN